jgi:DNA-binding LacI/PurR family transcriptional regulator
MSSADVAVHAGVSRSTVSQILNGHTDRFVPETVERVRRSARTLGYRPSAAGRTLVRGTSDIVITLVPDMAFSPFFRGLVGLLTKGLADAGYTNLLRLATEADALEDAVLSLRPFAVVAIVPLPPNLRDQLAAHGINVLEPTRVEVDATDAAIGRLQAQHLASQGYRTIVAAVPDLASEQHHSLPREHGVLDWCRRHHTAALPTITIPMQPGGAESSVAALPDGTGVAAYNDEVALAVMGAALHAGRRVPTDLGIVGVDDSTIARLATPSITTVALDVSVPGRLLLEAILSSRTAQESGDAPDGLPESLSIVPGQSTAMQ